MAKATRKSYRHPHQLNDAELADRLAMLAGLTDCGRNRELLCNARGEARERSWSHEAIERACSGAR